MKQTVNIEQCLKDIGFAVVPISGTSMWPLLKEGKSQIQLVSGGTKQLKKGDVVLYRREDGTLVLHRIIKIVKKKLEALSSFSIFVLLILLFYQEILQNLFDQQLNFYGHKMVLL